MKINKKLELINSEIIYLIKLRNSVFYFHFFILKFLSYEKLVMTSQFDLTQFYDVVIRNLVF